MKKVVIYLNSEERIVVYQEGGCQFESNIGPGVGWVVAHDVCRDWKTAIQETQVALARTLENIGLVS